MERKKISRLVQFIAARQKVRIDRIDIAVVGLSRITTLNRRYLGCDEPTDCLSFDLSDKPGGPISAQLVVCGPVAAKQAKMRGLSPQRELLLYITHAFLHLLEYDDTSADKSAEMSTAQEKLLDEFLAI